MALFDRPMFYPHAWQGDPWNRYQQWRDMIYGGERVIAQYGEPVGQVKQAYDDGFRIGRPSAGDIFLPYGAVKDVHDGEVQLNMPIDQVAGVYRQSNAPRASQSNGPHTGRGPRNYRRSDERIHEDVSHSLWADGQLDASEITVAVKDGVVTLDGTVDSRADKRAAEDLAWDVPGVVDVMNNLRPANNQSNQWRSQLIPGMDIVGSLGRKMGTVGEIRHGQFLANRSGQAGLWIPYSAIQDVRNNRVILNLPIDQLDDQGWPTTDTQPM